MEHAVRHKTSTHWRLNDDAGKISSHRQKKTGCGQGNPFTRRGKVTVNKITMDEYFPTEILRRTVMQPLNISDTLKKFNVLANVRGGGKTGQAEALRHGIARALLKFDEALRAALKSAGFLRRDPRMKERKKYGQKGARRRFQWTKR